MKTINLAESKIIERAYCRRLMNSRLKITGLVLFCAIVILITTTVYRLSLQHRLTHVQAKAKNAQIRMNELNTNMVYYKQVAGFESWRNELSDATKSKTKLMNRLIGTIPNDVWLNRVEYSQNSNTVIIDGYAVSHEFLWSYINILRNTQSFSQVRVQGSQSVGGNSPTVHFSVALDLPGAAQTANSEQPTQVSVNPNVKVEQKQ